MKFLIRLLLLVMITSIAACNANAPDTGVTSDADNAPAITEPEVIPLVREMEAAHNVAVFQQKDVVAFDIELFFGGQKRLEGTVYSKTNSTGVRLEKADGTVLVYDGEKVYQAPADADYPRARFDIFTWQYFFMAPFKFTDPGTNWDKMTDQNMKDKAYARAKLTFDANTGDAPDDWYIAYQDKETDLLEGLAYIVTFGGKQQEAAEAEPHAITYHDYEMVEGIPVAKNWKFWMWTEEKGFDLSQTIGEANISNVRFVEAGRLFITPENGKEVTL